MKCILDITINQYNNFVIKYGERNCKDKQFRVKKISVPASLLSYCRFTKNLKAINQRNAEKLYYIKHPINDWIEIIGCWLLQN